MLDGGSPLSSSRRLSPSACWGQPQGERQIVCGFMADTHHVLYVIHTSARRRASVSSSSFLSSPHACWLQVNPGFYTSCPMSAGRTRQLEADQTNVLVTTPHSNELIGGLFPGQIRTLGAFSVGEMASSRLR